MKNQKDNNNSNYKHGGKGTRLFNIWKGMKNRCLNSNNIGYKNYGGRGITVCSEWIDKLNGFINFRDWALDNGYKENLAIDRINNGGNYEPYNCRWVTQKENNKNQRLRIDSKIKNIGIANEIRELYTIGKYTQKELGIK